MITLTQFSNPNGAAVGKRYELVDGKPAKVRQGNPFASHCEVVQFEDALALTQHVGRLGGNKHLCAGLPRNGINVSAVTTKSKPKPGAITRSDSDFEFNQGTGIGLIDHDFAVGRPRLDAAQLLARLAAVLGWNLAEIPRVVYPSSSSHIECADGTASTGLRGIHALLIVSDASDWPRSLDCIFRRLVIAGEGWIYIGTDGRQHLRTLVDCTVSTSPSRQIYSGQASLDEGLRYSQDRAFRYHNAVPLDTRKAVPPLSLSELVEFDRAVAGLKAASATEADTVQATYRETRVAEMVASGVSETLANAAVAGAGARRLEGPWPITLADGTLISVDEILNAPAKYHGAYCLDPAEPDYDGGRPVAKIYADRGAVFVSSLAHGGNGRGGPTVFVLERSPLDGFDIIVSEQPASATTDTATTFSVPRLSKTDARDGTEHTRPLSELGNAHRLLDAGGDRLRYVSDSEAWLIWDGASWAWDYDGASVRAIAAELPDLIYAEGAGYPNDVEHFARWARRSGEKRTIVAAVSLASDSLKIRMPASRIDADLMTVGFDKGRQVIELTSGAVRPAKPSDYITKSLGCSSVGDASKAVRWKQFLFEVFGSDVELIDWMHRFCGYALTGSTTEQFFLFLHGAGANGKSVFIDVLRQLAGDYGRSIASETLSEGKRQQGAAAPDLAALAGARLGFCSETEDNRALAESMLKGLVAGDAMAPRQLNKGHVEFTPVLKLVMAGNHAPVVRGIDHGFWRRVRKIPFNVTFDVVQRDPDLGAKLKMELPHILAWAIEGCTQWQARGLRDTPAAVETATQEYRGAEDVLAGWMADCLVLDRIGDVSADVVYASYQNWCHVNGVPRPLTKAILTKRLIERRQVKRRSNGRDFWVGIEMAGDVADLDLAV